MPIPFSEAQRAAVAADHVNHYAVFEAQNPDGDFVNFSTGVGDYDWFNAVTLHDDIDANAMTMSAVLLRDSGSQSLAPLLESSTLNRNAATDYAPMLDLVRMWRVSVCVVPHGDPVPTFPDDYEEIGKGYIDSIQVDDLTSTIQVTGRGEEAILIDNEILTIRRYSIGTTDDLETVLQAIIDDNMDDPPTLYVPVPTSHIVDEYDQDVGNLMGVLQAGAMGAGYSLRYRYDSAGVNRFTLFLPNREAEEGEEDWEIAPTEYLRLPKNLLDIQGVRNYIPVRYYNKSIGLPDNVLSPLSGTSGSITTFRRRPMPIDLSADTQITTEARAQALADAIRADLEYPKLEQTFETYGFWFVQLTDWGKMLANGTTY